MQNFAFLCLGLILGRYVATVEFESKNLKQDLANVKR